MKKLVLFLVAGVVMMGVVACNGGEPAPTQGSAEGAPAATSDVPEAGDRSDAKQATTGVDPNDPGSRGRR